MTSPASPPSNEAEIVIQIEDVIDVQMSRTSEQVKHVKDLHDKYGDEMDFGNGRLPGASLSSTLRSGTTRNDKHQTTQPREKPSDELGFVDSSSPKSANNQGRNRTTRKRATTKKGAGIQGAEENDDEDEDYDDCVTVDGVQVAGQFGQKKQEKVFQYKDDLEEDDDDNADQNYNPQRKSRGSSYFAKGKQNFAGKKVTANRDADNISDNGGSVYSKGTMHISKKPIIGGGVVQINSNGGIDSDDDSGINGRDDRRITKYVNNQPFDFENSDDESQMQSNNQGKVINTNRRYSDDY